MDFSGIEAIIFDNDGVVVDSETIHVAVERAFLAELGLEYDSGTYLSRFVGLKNADFHAALNQDFRTKFGAPLPRDFRDRLDARAWPRLEMELQAMTGISELVKSFGGKVAIASSASEARLYQKLEITGLTGLFAPWIYSSDYVENGKPEPDLFLYAADKLGVPARHCLVVEDSVNGVIAGRAAGMSTVGFTGGGHTDANHATRLKLAGADFCVESHAELATLLRGG